MRDPINNMLPTPRNFVTPRELEVIVLVRNACFAIGARNRMDLVLKCIRAGLIKLGTSSEVPRG